MQQHMAQQAAFSQIPDVVKGVRDAIIRNIQPKYPITENAVHPPLPPSCIGQQPPIYHCCVREWLEQVHRKVLFENRVARSRADCTISERRCALSSFLKAYSKLDLIDPIFLILYRELYYRHVYSCLQSNIDDRFHSYENSCELFNYPLSKRCVFTKIVTFILNQRSDSDGSVELELPEQWLWDIIDEFIYQYQVFCTWRSKVTTKTQDELIMLAEGVWTDFLLLLLSANDFPRSGAHTVS